jgi:hypothetical protein
MGEPVCAPCALVLCPLVYDVLVCVTAGQEGPPPER